LDQSQNAFGTFRAILRAQQGGHISRAARLFSTKTMLKKASLALLGLLSTTCTWMAGCAHQEYFPSSTILKTEENSKIIETVEQYRRKLLERNVEGLLLLASDRYFEDSGTPRSDDDYGYEGLRLILSQRLTHVQSMRYEIEYRAIRRTGNRAEVEVFLDGSFELNADHHDRYRRVNDFHRFILEQQPNEKWQFLSGM
jgi:hypothetical protein